MELIYLNLKSGCTFFSMGPFNEVDLGLVFDWMSFCCTESRKKYALLRMSKIWRPSEQSRWPWHSRKKISRWGLEEEGPHPGAGVSQGPAPLSVPETSSPSLRFCARELKHVSSSPPNTDVGFVVWYWPLSTWGDILICKCPGPERRLWLAVRFSEAACAPVWVVVCL